MAGKDILRLSAPFIAMGGVWLAQQAMGAGYKAVTGRSAPNPDDLAVPLGKALLYATTTAIAAAVVNTLVTRGIAKATAQPELERAAGL